ncbi:hypothetical protein [Spiroplasma endosymbiont of Poecilobothrus nobilitatus]|uniref:hypothetical protein n=1 Tax=Spiroplasma endosymbiont of Poecilobothrus nobilitatus TaxID=1209220 RepID=UPI00313F1C6A
MINTTKYCCYSKITTHKERIIANSELDDFNDFTLDDEDMAALFALPQVRLGAYPNNFFNFLENSWLNKKNHQYDNFKKNYINF